MFFSAAIFSCADIAHAQSNIEIVDFNKLQQVFLNKSDTTYYINFFASWCAPCIKELPDFELFAKEQSNQKVKVIYVSLDLVNTYQQSLVPLVNNLKLSQKIYLLNEADPNNWMNKINKEWSGAIPATLIVNQQKKYNKFISNSLSNSTLKKYLP